MQLQEQTEKALYAILHLKYVIYWEIIPLSAYAYGASAITNDKKFKSDKIELFKNEMFLMGYRETVVNRQVYAAAGSSFGSYLLTSLGYLVFDPKNSN